MSLFATPFILNALLSLTVPEVSACPVCHSATGLQVQAGIFGDDFAFNLAAILSPFLLSAVLVAFICHKLPLK